MFIREVSRKNKMRCFFVTARSFSEEVQKEADALGIEALYTGGKPKMKFCEDHNTDIHIWIDDMPELLFSKAER
jgi:3-deoxy-D-manno-octulosonate 8-phosphate phosphatase KdsC-like HAD superfamily phosphatase